MMDLKRTNQKTPLPLGTVLITVVLTVILSGSVAYLSGYLGPKRDMAGHADATQGASHEAHEETLYSCGMHPWIISNEPGNCPICGMKLTPKRDEEQTRQDTTERKIAYWRAPMNPQEIYDEPGKSAMGMDLVPVYEDEVIGGVAVKVDPVTQQNMGLRTAVVKKGPLIHTIRTYGHITYDESRTAQINPKFSGWFEKLYVDFTGQLVKKGQPLYDIYAPELVTAQEEYLEAYRNLNSTGRSGKKMLASVRRRLQYFDIADAEIKALERKGTVLKTVTVRSPFEGVVVHKNAVEGGYVMAGTTVYQIADLSRVWVEAHIYEYELHRVSVGQPAQMILPYWPGKSYIGKVTYIYPYLQKKTRDVRVRLEFENPDLMLKPEMYADIRIETREGEGMLIPSEAVIRSGERNIVFVTRPGHKFAPREVTLGIGLDDGLTHIRTGLAPGETIVTSGQFLLDSESKLKEAVQKMLEAKQSSTSSNDTTKVSADDFFDDMDSDTAQPDDSFFDDM